MIRYDFVGGEGEQGNGEGGQTAAAGPVQGVRRSG